jgi:predicted amidohydrolase
MTCYDLRFPELALSSGAAGADVLVLPAAWVKGPLKSITGRRCWRRALDTTCYVVAAGECGKYRAEQGGRSAGVTIAAARKRRIC